MHFIGVERVFLYDSYDPSIPEERLQLEPAIQRLIATGFVGDTGFMPAYLYCFEICGGSVSGCEPVYDSVVC